MAQSISLWGATYNDVPGVELPKSTSGTAYFADPSGTTAVAADVTQGKWFLTDQGVLTQGTASGGGGGADVPTFTWTYDSEWLVVSVACDKTYSECLDIALAGIDCYAVVVNQLAPGEGDAYTTTAVFDLDDWDNPTMIVFRTVDSTGFPVDEFHYLADGTITLPTRADWADCPTIMTNGQHYPNPGRYFWGVVVNVPTSVGFTLLQTTPIGSLSTSSTSAVDTGKTISLASSTKWNDYDLLIVDISVDTPTNGRHTSTVSLVILTGTGDVRTKNTYAVGSNKWNSKLSSNGTASTRQSTSACGVYINAASVSSNTLTLTVYYRYNSNSTGTLNGTYTARVYGVKLMDLIGG